jgi:hypothetical protein
MLTSRTDPHSLRVACASLIAATLGACSPAASPDAGAPLDATSADAQDATAPGPDIASETALDGTPDADVAATCAAQPAVSGQPCSPGGLQCSGARYMCYTATQRGPAGIEQCTCVAGAWQCTDTCAAWLASMTDH